MSSDEPDPVPAVPAEPAASPTPEGRVYRSKRRPGLTSAGVAVIGAAISLVAALLSVLVSDTLNWVFTVPFILVSGYCAWEVRADRMRAALVMPPLVMLAVVVMVPWVSGDADSLRSGLVRSVNTLIKMAPPLTGAVALAGAILAWRRWGPGKS
jgi:hypothetical protein